MNTCQHKTSTQLGEACGITINICDWGCGHYIVQDENESYSVTLYDGLELELAMKEFSRAVIGRLSKEPSE